MISAQEARRAVWRPLLELPRRRALILLLARRELAARYRGSALGTAWGVLTPLVMIAIYTFVFAGIFGARFGASGSKWDYAVYLFCGLLPWTAFQEAIQLSSNVIVTRSNLVKRVVFPLETLPASQTLVALANQLFGSVALVVAALLTHHRPSASLLWLPLLLVPQVVATLGAAWLIAALGVFLRDTPQVVSLTLTAWLFLTPIIYPETVVPVEYRRFVNLNPFTPLVRSYRRVMLEAVAPDWRGLAYFSGFALLLFAFGYWWFAKTRKNFADVI